MIFSSALRRTLVTQARQLTRLKAARLFALTDFFERWPW